MNDEPAAATLNTLVPRLRQFITVGREEHLTRAAEILGVLEEFLRQYHQAVDAAWVRFSE